MVKLPICVLKLYYLGNYWGIAVTVNYTEVKSLITIARGGKLK